MTLLIAQSLGTLIVLLVAVLIAIVVTGRSDSAACYRLKQLISIVSTSFLFYLAMLFIWMYIPGVINV